MAFLSPSELDARLHDDKRTPGFQGHCLPHSRPSVCIYGRKGGRKDSKVRFVMVHPLSTRDLWKHILGWNMVLWARCSEDLRPSPVLGMALCSIFTTDSACIYCHVGHTEASNQIWAVDIESFHLDIFSFPFFQMASYRHNEKITTFGQLHWTRQ